MKQRPSILCIRFTLVPSNWASEGQHADLGHDHSTGTLAGQSVGSELFLQSLNDAPDPAPLRLLSSSVPCRVWGIIQKTLKGGCAQPPTKPVHSSDQQLPLLRGVPVDGPFCMPGVI